MAMQKDPRIILYQYEENKDSLYSKTKGILNSKGKYVMTLAHDGLYTHKEMLFQYYRIPHFLVPQKSKDLQKIRNISPQLCAIGG